MKSARTSFGCVAIVLGVVAVGSGVASASTITIKYSNGCCCEDAHDCTLSSSANSVCDAGHAVDLSSARGCGADSDYIPFIGKCFGVGCVGPDDSTCHADIGAGSYLSPAPPIPPEIPLNGIDDNCNGLIDECNAGDAFACSTKLRSCTGPFPGTELCGANGFPSNVCTANQVGDIDNCPKAACLGGVIDNTDSDGDGLLDCWETQGIDFDGDGVVDLTLPGANPQHKDIFVESDFFDCTVAGGDCMAGDTHEHGPTAAAQLLIAQTYANAPVTNPDGTTGINFHMVVDEALPHQNNCSLETCVGLLKASNFGTVAERANPKTRNAKRLAFHYAIWGHVLGPGVKNSGKAELPGADLIITLGTSSTIVGTDSQQAATFVHELGHNLGLGHGGGDGINYKPNYLSVMNYQFTFSGVMPAGTIDYSRAALPTLDENALVESAGIGDGTDTTVFFCPDETTAGGQGNKPINWDCKDPPNLPNDVVAEDINNDRVCITAGKDGVVESVKGGDDVLGGGAIVVGTNMILDTTPSGDDTFGFFFLNGVMTFSVLPGKNGTIDTVPVGDDVIVGQAIWDGANRTCETTVGGDDLVDASAGTSRDFGTVQPNLLTGYDDWAHIGLDFDSKLTKYAVSSGPGISYPIEPEIDRATLDALRSQVADLTLTQALSRSADGGVVVSLTVTNNGPKSAESVAVNDRLPAQLSYRSCASTAGGVCHLLGSSYVGVTFTSLASGQSATITITGCTVATTAISNVATVNSVTSDPNLADNTATGQLAAPTALPAQQLPNGDMRYAITFPVAQAYVEAFVQVNGVQTISGNIVSSRGANADGSSTYSRVVPAAQYHAGDAINVRFYSYRSGQPAVYTPGPIEFLSYPDFIYGTGNTTCSPACRPTFAQRPNGDVTVSHTFTTPWNYVEAFVRDNSTQVGSGNIVQSGVANLDGTFTYGRTVPASSFHTGDAVTYRFYSYVTGGPQVFTPGPSQSVWFPGFVYNRAPTSDCPP